MLKVRTSVIMMFAIVMSSVSAFAVNPDEVLSDATLEARARALSAEIRCLVCQNQSIDDSDAQLARDLRVLVREQLVEGRSDQEILDFLVARYGEFVLLKPRFGLHTLFLWGLPLIAFLIGLFALFRFYKREPQLEDAALTLSADELEALEVIVEDKSTS